MKKRRAKEKKGREKERKKASIVHGVPEEHNSLSCARKHFARTADEGRSTNIRCPVN